MEASLFSSIRNSISESETFGEVGLEECVVLERLDGFEEKGGFSVSKTCELLVLERDNPNYC